MFVLCQASQDQGWKERGLNSQNEAASDVLIIFRGVSRIVNWRAKSSYFSHTSSHRENVASARRVDFTTVRYFSRIVWLSEKI